MIPLTPLFSRYKDSFFLYAFRHIDRIRTCQSREIAEILATELTYLYSIACVITYKDEQANEIEQLKNWALELPSTFDLQQMQVLFIEKTEELNLRAFQPKKYSYSFTTIWDTIHFLAIVVDDMIDSRDKLTYEIVTANLQQMKTIFYNLFFKLNCAMCREHYLGIKGFLIFSIERIEISLNREKFGEKIIMVDEITIKNSNQNTLMKHGTLYATMVFHNHINDYRYIQRNMMPVKHFERMTWAEYKKSLHM
ncbi:ORF-84 peptide [Chrysodeixis chalcites nucleopolyhedrovirus]|uniref:ORF-84 peptide n=1 Tax=Chrysodeixis chalcites nucleopolyhedrovirus TaxID=320432 RepID=Q4KSZ6_9ABAC|nr:ORF-84 peptide [Chrysodeixis chalcites nucleopolyhedrovirus]AGC36299.1 hypothetical protein TF1A_0084 [Chrysodeixis chalcites SNPV TF1-A]AAY84015.1 ORF-84 peptide [Chrysodeixis chalcites nucleopolyhedrovirus]AGE61346.1 hypothetical protein [Chrysodeixis chalcites nucleopolyhedrovirus]AGE61492.1 hypothetical protein [Chrysodeixis chalcites nucleopolyhedrovirus]AGE61645.1 hypothetical protein [Chrysodeixis chalcites nucleopolyhedrovirus]